MNDFSRKFLTGWRKLALPFSDETIVVAVSGGADSVALAVVLHELKERKKLNLRFVIAHFNHGLRGEYSESDERLVKTLTEKLDFELVLGKDEISKNGNLEQNARIGRYRFLKQAAENLNAKTILTAHTMNDQAETFLMNLIRGSGIEGLGGMKTVRALNSEDDKSSNQKDGVKLIRPFLNWAKREDTENYCHRNEIEYCLDEMNNDLRFQRVRIRKVLLPLLKDFNPKIVENLAATAKLLRAEIEHKSDGESKVCEEALSLNELKKMPQALLYKSLRHWLRYKRGNLRRLELKHIEAVERLIFSRKSGKIVELPDGETIVKSNGKLQFKKTKVEK